MSPVNNITRFLDSQKVPYVAFETPAEKLGARETAEFLDVPLSQVFKTIVVTRDKPKKPLLAVIPGENVVDLKPLAAFLGEKKVHLPPLLLSLEMLILPAATCTSTKRV